ncbi:MAG: urate hydroxylase PuuD, partial [Proteobacteria bacterium]|nr:urate hydroxylase PuuD [Pseudomonadota bacterium]
GITWIGLLYYFNFIQGEYFKEAEDAHRSGAIQKLVPRALWWFRWAAMFTFLTGVILLAYRHQGLTYDITIGAILGTLMFLNVWGIIWPNQKIVIASATQVAQGGDALPEAAAAAPKAALASRTNTLFSFPMLFFMGSSAHMGNGLIGDASTIGIAAILIVIAALEVNSIVGKQGPMTSVRGVIGSGVGLTAVLYGLMAVL